LTLCFALLAWLAQAELLASIAKTATGKTCNVCKTFGRLGQDCVKILGHESSFPNRHWFQS